MFGLGQGERERGKIGREGRFLKVENMSKQNRSKKSSKHIKSKQSSNNISTYWLEERNISISKMTMDILLRSKEKPSNVIALYFFYSYTSIWQKTFTPKCTVAFAAKALQISQNAVRKAKAELIHLDLAEEIKTHHINKRGRNVIQYYIHIKCKDGNGEIHKEPYQNHEGTTRFALCQNRKTTKSIDKCFETNSNKCFETNNSLPQQNAEGKGCVELNSSSPTIFGNSPVKSNFATTSAKKLWSKVVSKRQLPPNSKDRSKWAMQFTMLNQRDGRTKKRIRSVLDWYLEHYGEDYVPEARCANTFRKKFCSIESAMNRWLKKQGQDVRDSDPQVIRQNIGHRQMD